MPKCLVATDGRDFQVFVCDYTEEQRLDLENSGFFDGVTEFELIEDKPGADNRFMLLTTPTQARIVPWDDALLNKSDPVDGEFCLCAQGPIEDIVREVDALQELIDQGN